MSDQQLQEPDSQQQASESTDPPAQQQAASQPAQESSDGRSEPPPPAQDSQEKAPIQPASQPAKEEKKSKEPEPQEEERDDKSGTHHDTTDTKHRAKRKDEDDENSDNDQPSQEEKDRQKELEKERQKEEEKEKERQKAAEKERERKKAAEKEKERQKKEELEKEEEVTKKKKKTHPTESPNGSPRPSTETSEGRKKQKEFFKLELNRLESGLKRESSKINPPSKKPHMPYVFNTLEPYYNTYTTRFLIHLPDEIKHGHTSRHTAQGLTDPWVDLKMDRNVLPAVPSKPVSRQMASLKKEKEIRDRKKRSALAASSSSRKEGSTRLPKFPVVQLETADLATKQLYYSDVPALRHELKTKYSSSAKSKIDEDYKRTQQDFYRMELDKLDEVHPINRTHMRSAYFAYLQNTPGSKKAITECVKGLKSGKA